MPTSSTSDPNLNPGNQKANILAFILIRTSQMSTQGQKCHIGGPNKDIKTHLYAHTHTHLYTFLETLRMLLILLFGTFCILCVFQYAVCYNVCSSNYLLRLPIMVSSEYEKRLLKLLKNKTHGLTSISTSNC